MGDISIWQLIIILIMLGLAVMWTLLLARVVSKAGFSTWWALISLVPMLNIIFLWIFAFSKWPAQKSEAQQGDQAQGRRKAAPLGTSLVTQVGDIGMNDKQKKALMAVAIVVLAMLIYPPYIQQIGGAMSTATTSGYAFIFELPFRATIHISTLIIQWVGVLIVGGISFLMVKD